MDSKLGANVQNDTGNYSVDDFFSGVASILEQSLQQDPARQDFRLRLLEVYCATGQKKAFETHAREYRLRLKDENEPDWQRITAMGKTLLSPDNRFEKLASPPAAGKPGNLKFARFGDSAEPAALALLSEEYKELRKAPHFFREIDQRQVLFTGERPSPLYWANRLSLDAGGAQIHLKREGLRSLGAHKLLNAMGQVLVAKKLGRKRVTVATVSGQTGVAAAAAAAHLGLRCTVYMRSRDVAQNRAMANRIELFGAELHRIEDKQASSGTTQANNYVRRLNLVRNLALADWLEHRADSFYVNGLAAGPDPYPTMQQDFLAIIGRETREAMITDTGTLPAALVASTNSEMDIISYFTPFLGYKGTRLHATSCIKPRGEREFSDESRLRRDHQLQVYSNEQISAAARILSTQGFPSTRREHEWLKATGRVDYHQIDADSANAAARALSSKEGLIVSQESAAALFHAMKLAAKMKSDQHIVVLLNDIGTVLATSPELAALDGSAWG